MMIVMILASIIIANLIPSLIHIIMMSAVEDVLMDIFKIPPIKNVSKDHAQSM